MIDLIRSLSIRAARQKAETAQTHYQRYRSLLADSAAGREVDLAELEQVLESLGKSAADIATDSELYEKRSIWAAELRDGTVAAGELQRASQELDRLMSEQAAWLAKHGEKLSKQQELLRDAEHRATRTSVAKSNLAMSCDDPAVVAEERRLADLRDQLHGESEENETLLRRLDAKINHVRRRISDLQKKIEVSKNARTAFDAMSPDERRETLKDIAGREQELAKLLDERSQVESLSVPIRQQYQQVLRDFEKLAAAKLIP